ncbi:hypothetical protein B0H16DRAFT_1479073 [Mycena metata]|uniref:AMP-dependent synthetase/ligase domain-containing protein n=1 Tax=Mycena metata TaxID=1033252 RepID=A0AAD7H5Y9_9AGAR|nr:hypothetical protein B0H16DRAFT_1479073 [Mycena metata]
MAKNGSKTPKMTNLRALWCHMVQGTPFIIELSVVYDSISFGKIRSRNDLERQNSFLVAATVLRVSRQGLWYYQRTDQRVGPVSVAEQKSIPFRCPWESKPVVAYYGSDPNSTKEVSVHPTEKLAKLNYPQTRAPDAHHPAVKDADLSSLRVVFMDGAPMSVHLAKAMGEIVPHAVVEQGYGMTELTGILTMPPLNRRVATDAVAHILPGFTARVLKADGSVVQTGESGELYVTGPSIALYYVNNEEMWVRTGDEVYFDENEELHIVDRIKDFIKVRGYQVASAELEALLVTNLDITDCCVIGVSHKFSGQVPKAYAVLSKDAQDRIRQNPEDKERIKAALIADIAEKKAKYKRLVGGVEFIGVIPKTPSGKFLKGTADAECRNCQDVTIRAKIKRDRLQDRTDSVASDTLGVLEGTLKH